MSEARRCPYNDSQPLDELMITHFTNYLSTLFIYFTPIIIPGRTSPMCFCQSFVDINME